MKIFNSILNYLSQHNKAGDTWAFRNSILGQKLLFSILLFSTFVTLFLTSIQIYLDYRKGVNGIYETVDQIRATQLKSLAQNLWNINNEQIEIQLKGLLEIVTITKLTIYPVDDKPISLKKKVDEANTIITTYPINYTRGGENIYLGKLEIVSDISPVLDELKSRIFVILLTQGAKTFIVSLFILFIFNILVNKHILDVGQFAKKLSLETIGQKLTLSRGPQERPDELDDLAHNLNIMQSKIAAEIQQRKKFENQLRQSQKMEALGTLASGIAHDFNNILQGLYNALFLVEEEVIDNADALDKVTIANNLVDRARELVKQILIYTRQDEGIFSRFSPIPPIQDVVEILRAAAQNDVKIDFIVEPAGGFIYGDKTQLKQVLINLGNNALHALEEIENPFLRISLKPEVLRPNNDHNLEAGEYLKITVEDNGHGMSKEVQERIFEPFFTTKDIDEGTGLGLSVVHGIMEGHKGAIEVQSRLRNGTIFTLYFPLIKRIQKKDERTYQGHEHIHIISNDSEVRFKLSETLTELKHNFTLHKKSAPSLEEIMAHGKENPDAYFIFIIDEAIEDFSAEEVIRKLRQFYAKTPILLLSDKSEAQRSLPYTLRVSYLSRKALLESTVTPEFLESVRLAFNNACHKLK